MAAAAPDFKTETPISEALAHIFPGKDVAKWVTQLVALDVETVGDVRLITEAVWRTLPGLSPVLLSGLGALRQGKLLVPAGWDTVSHSRIVDAASLAANNLSFIALQTQFRGVRQYHTMIVQQERYLVKQIRETTNDFHKKTQDALLLRSLLTEVDDTTLQSYYHFLDGNTTDEPILNPQTLGAETDSLVNQYTQFVQYLREQPRTMALLGPLGGQTQKPRPGPPGAPPKRRGLAEIICYGVYGSAYQAIDTRHLIRALGLILHQELSVHRSRSLSDEAKGDKNVKALRLLGESESANAPASALYSQSFAVKMAHLNFNRYALELCSPFFSSFTHAVCRMDVELEPGSTKEDVSKSPIAARAEQPPPLTSQKTAVLKKFVKGKLAKPGVAMVKKPSQQSSTTVKSKEQLQNALIKYCDMFFDIIIKATKRWPLVVLQTLGVIVREFMRQWIQMRTAHVVFHVFYSLFILPVLNVDASWAPPTLFPVFVNPTQSNNLRVVMKVVETILEAAAFKDGGQPERSNKAWADMPGSLRNVAKDYITSKIPIISAHLTSFASIALESVNVKAGLSASNGSSTRDRVFNLALSLEDIILLRDTILKHLEDVPLNDPNTTLASLAVTDAYVCGYCGTRETKQTIACMTCSQPRENGNLNLSVSYEGLKRFANLPALGAGIAPKRKILLRLGMKDTFLDSTPLSERKSNGGNSGGGSNSEEPDESLNALRFILPDMYSQIEEIYVNYEQTSPPESNNGDNHDEQTYDIARCLAQVLALEHWDRHDMNANDLVGLADSLQQAINAEMGSASAFLHNPVAEAVWRSGSSAVALLEDLLAWVLIGAGDKSSTSPGAEMHFEQSPLVLVRNIKIMSDFKKVRELVRDTATQLQRKLSSIWSPREQKLFSVLDVMRAAETKLGREIEFLRSLIFHHSLLSICLETSAPLSVRTQVPLRAPEIEEEEEESNVSGGGGSSGNSGNSNVVEKEKDTYTFACSNMFSLIEQYRKYRSVLETHRHIGAQLLHCFQETLEKKLSKKLPKPEQVKHASELVEAYICTALFDCLFEEAQGSTQADIMLANKLKMGFWVRPAHLGLLLIPEKQLRRKVEANVSRRHARKESVEIAVKAEYDRERQKEADMLRVLWGRPCEELCGLEDALTPLRKLLCLTRTIKLIFENLKALSRGATFDADTCLSALIGVIIHTPPIRLIANIQYINSFRHINKLDGEDQYCITQFNLAISFISNADFDFRAANSNSLLQSRRNTIQPVSQQAARTRSATRIIQVEQGQVVIALSSPLFTILSPSQLLHIFQFLSTPAVASLALSCRLASSTCRPPLRERGILQSTTRKSPRPGTEDDKNDSRAPPPPPSQDNGDREDGKKVGACSIPAVAKHTYDASAKTTGSYLSFIKGETLTITKMKSDRWWWAVSEKDQKGWVPSSYVTLMGPPPEPTS